MRGGRSRLSRVRTGGMTMPSSMASLRRRARTRSSRSPPVPASTRSIRSAASSSSSGSTRMSPAMRLGRVRRGPAASAAAGLRGPPAPALVLLRQPLGDEQQRAADEQERQLGQAGDQASAMTAPPAICSARLLRAELAGAVGAHVVLGGGAGDDQAGGDREQQGRDLGDQAVADGQQAVASRSRRRSDWCRLHHADGEAADQVDQRDDDGGDRVALDELARHRPSRRRSRPRRRPRPGGGAPRPRRSGRS